jgi:hypothetical protein
VRPRRGLQGIRTRWERGDFSEHAAPVEYPEHELREYVHRHFADLKDEQKLLLGKVQGGQRKAAPPAGAPRAS